MAIDLTGGMDPSKDHFLAERPEDPDFRESASFWVFDDRGEIGLPRIGIEAVASEWDKRGLQLNLANALFDQILARRGFAILKIDNRGMANRGKQFIIPSRRKLGEIGRVFHILYIVFHVDYQDR